MAALPLLPNTRRSAFTHSSVDLIRLVLGRAVFPAFRGVTSRILWTWVRAVLVGCMISRGIRHDLVSERFCVGTVWRHCLIADVVSAVVSIRSVSDEELSQ